MPVLRTVLLAWLASALCLFAQWVPDSTFRLKAGDRVKTGVYRVHGETTVLMEETLALSGTGHVTLPNGQRVKLSNSELRMVGALIEEGFRDRNDLAGLNVKAHVLAINDRPIVALFGEVKTPGHTSFTEGMTLADLVARAGGIRQGANLRRVNLFRRGTLTHHDCREDGTMAQIPIEAGDIVHFDLSFLH